MNLASFNTLFPKAARGPIVSSRELLLTVLLLFLACTSVSAQRGQIIPPFLKTQTAPQTVVMGDKTFMVPDFSIAPFLPASGGNEFITSTPIGFLATRLTDGGLQLEARRFRDVFRAAEFFRSTPNPLLVTEGLGRTPNGPVFDFTKSAPHLAFFCRLEINENKGFVIPAKFRLGGHSYWQDNLLRRE